MRPLVVGWIFTVVNHVLIFMIGVTVARWFGAADYGAYAVTVAILALLGTAATLGLGKSSLNMLSVYRQRGEWSQYHGYIRGSFFLIIAVSIILDSPSWEGLLFTKSISMHQVLTPVVFLLFILYSQPGLPFSSQKS
ncbi:MAG: hypothetical protein N2A97_05040 [Thermodesulfobacteriales bacterium]